MARRFGPLLGAHGFNIRQVVERHFGNFQRYAAGTQAWCLPFIPPEVSGLGTRNHQYRRSPLRTLRAR